MFSIAAEKICLFCAFATSHRAEHSSRESAMDVDSSVSVNHATSNENVAGPRNVPFFSSASSEHPNMESSSFDASSTHAFDVVAGPSNVATLPQDLRR